MADIRLNIKLHKNQQYIQDNAGMFNVVKAGKRFGKTKWALYRALQKSALNPGGVVWYVAPTYGQAEKIAWRELLFLLPRQFIKRKLETKLLLELTNDCVLQLIGADNEDNLRGPRLHHAVLDEAAYMKESIWHDILHGQLLGAGANSGTADFISSPNRTGINWFTDFHADAKKKMESGNNDWRAFYYTIYDNPTIGPEKIEDLRLSMPEDSWLLNYMAQESAYSGLRFKEFHFDRHVKDNQNLGLLVRGLDWGLDHPTVCLWVWVDIDKKHVHVDDEFVKSGFLISDSCEHIKERTGKKPVEWSVIDPSTSKKNSQTGRRDMDEFARYGIACVPGDNKDRGYDIMNMFFKRDMISISPKCRQLIYELRNVQYGQKDGDDCTDALRYVLVRIHDFMFGGKEAFESEKPEIKYTPEYLKERRECNLNNKYMFPESRPNQMSWIQEEAEVN